MRFDRAKRHLVIVLCGMMSAPVEAQSVPVSNTSAAALDDAELRPANIATYHTPRLCVAAVTREEELVAFDLADSMALIRPRLAPDSVVRGTARQCLDKFRVDAVAIDELPSMVHLAIAADAIDVAQRAGDRYLQDTTARRPDQRAWRLYQLIAVALDAEGERFLPGSMSVPLARAYLRQLDAMSGAETYEARWSVHKMFARYDKMIDDEALLLQDGIAMVSAVNAVPLADWGRFDQGTMNGHLQDGLGQVGEVLMARALRGGPKASEGILAELQSAVQSSVSDERFRDFLVRIREGIKVTFGQIGQSIPALHSPYVYDVRPDTPVRTVPAASYPRTGQITMLYVLPIKNQGDDGSQSLNAIVPMLRRFKAAYGDALDVVVVAHTAGTYFDSLGVALPPEREADAIAREYATRRLPGTLFVDVTPYQQFPAPDLRRMNKQTTTTTVYGDLHVALIDRWAHLRLFGKGAYPNDELFLRRALEGLVAEREGGQK